MWFGDIPQIIFAILFSIKNLFVGAVVQPPPDLT